MRRVLVFYPHNLYPPRSGSHRRGLEMLKALQSAGCKVTLASSELCAYPAWKPSAVESLRHDLGIEVRIHTPTPRDLRFGLMLPRIYRLLGRTPPVNSAIKTPPGMRAWFRHVAREVRSDVIVMYYAYWDGLIGRWARSQCRVMEAHDLLTLNRQMWGAIKSRLPKAPIDPQQVPESLLSEDYYDRLGLEPLPEEFRVYDKYDYTISISAKEADAIKRNSRRTHTLVVPMTPEPTYVKNTYRDAPVFVTGPNPFNVQGCLYFVRRVLPKILSRLPEFRLRVTGYVCDIVSPVEGVVMSGFVPDLTNVYENCMFAICPVFGGTGQQIKIAEALAHGVPVVSLQAAAASSPLRHGENGFIVKDAEEFAEYVIQLWRDPGLRARLGAAGRETTAALHASSPLLESLSVILGG